MQTIPSLFSISSIYKEITDLWIKKEQSDDVINEDSFSNIVDLIDDFIESRDYNTEISENCIRDNEEFLNKRKLNIPKFYEEIVNKLSERIDTEESWNIGETSALKEAENILIKAKFVAQNENQHSARNQPVDDQKHRHKSSLSLKAKSLIEKSVGSTKGNHDTLSDYTEINNLLNFADDSKYPKAEEKYSYSNDRCKLETIVEKDFEEKDEFTTKWNRFTNLIQAALKDRKHKDVLLKAINRSFPKTIEFMKIRFNNTDINYEHDIIDRFEKSILKSYESLFELKREYESEIEELKDQLNDNIKI